MGRVASTTNGSGLVVRLGVHLNRECGGGVMSAAVEGTGTATRFVVDGIPFGGGPAVYSYSPYVELVLTADAEQVARRLPSRHLHPMLWFNGRALVIVSAADCVLRVGDVPPFRFGGVYLVAMATYGSVTAPPVLPLAGQGLPLIGDIVDRRYRPGVVFLASVVTNRVAAEIPRLWFGVPALVGAIRHQRAADRHCVTATDPTGAAIIGVEAATGGRATSVEQVGRTYHGHGPALVAQSERLEGRLSMRWGAKSGQLRLGQHPWASQVLSLSLSTRPLLTRVQSTCTGTIDQAPVRLGPADNQQPVPATDPHTREQPLVICDENSQDVAAEQMLDGLPFEAAGRFEHPAATAETI